MIPRLHHALDALAAAAPPPRVPPDLYRTARRAYRRRVLITTAVGCLAVLTATSLAVGAHPAVPDPLVGAATTTVGSPAYRWSTWLGGLPGWGLLAGVLSLLAMWWRHRPWRVLGRRLLAVGLAGAAVVLSAPPGLALWGEPAGPRGLPGELVAPPTWAARVQDSPIGRAAVLFGGPATSFELEEGALALVAGDGPRYRFIDQFTLPVPGRESMLSGDGRYVSYAEKIVDVSTGRAGPSVPGPVVAWSADGRRLAFARPNVNFSLERTAVGVYDLPSRQIIGEFGVFVSAEDSEFRAALSPDGTRLALTIGGVLELYRVGEDRPYLRLPASAADLRLAGTAAWAPDGRAIAMARATTCEPCPVATWRRQWQLELIDPETGARVTGPTYRALPSIAALRVLGWRSATEPIVQISGPPTHRAAEEHPGGPLSWRDDLRGEPRVATLGPDGAPPHQLLRVPPGVLDVDIAAQYATGPVYRAVSPTSGPPHPYFSVPTAVLAVGLVLVLAVRRWPPRLSRRTFLDRHMLDAEY